MRDVVIFGTEKMAELAHFYFTHDSPFRVAAFSVNAAYLKATEFRGLPVVPFEEVERRFPPDGYDMFVAIGYKRLNGMRAEKYTQAKQKGYRLVSYLSSKATHWNDTVMGENCFILENQVIQPAVRFGDDVIVWSGNHFGHDVVIGDHCWLSSHIVVSGGVQVGPHTFIGVNVTIRDGVRVGSRCIIGAGAIILKDAADGEVYVARQTELYRLDSQAFERMMEISRD